MSIVSVGSFDQLRDDLAALFASTASQYAKNVGLEALDVSALGQMSASLTDSAAEVLMFGCNTWPEGTEDEVRSDLPFEASLSEVDPPRSAFQPYLVALLAVGVSTPIAILISHFADFANAVVWPFALLFITMVLGRAPALLGCLIAVLAHNFFLIEPSLAFSAPSAHELSLSAFYVILVITVPWLAARAPVLRSWVL